MARIGPWEAVAELGHGATGRVLRARDAGGREVALKLLHAHAAATPQRRQRFLQEARAMARVRHPSLVGIVDAGEAPSGPWIAMELVPGETLAARLAREGRLPVPTALHLAEQLASAVAVLHAAGVLHRDINPRNVLLRAPGGEPVLLDLGLARELEPTSVTRATLEGRSLGTPGYWPPEQASGELGQIGPASDVYALGATLHAMLTGEPPFRVETIQDALRVLSEEPRPPSRLRPGLPPELDRLVLRCLARRPADRVPSAAYLADALRVARRAPPGASRPARAARLAAGLVLLAAATAAAILLLRARAAPPLPAPPPVVASPAPPAPVVAPAPVIAAPPPVQALAPATDKQARVLLSQARERAQERDWARALELVDRALALAPDHPEALLYRASMLSSTGDRAGARAAIERAVAVAPEQARPIGMRGIMRLEERDYAGAVADLSRSIELDPGDRLAWHNRACAHLFLHDAAAALADEDRVLRITPDYPAGNFIRARALEELGRPAEAREAAERALTAQPRYAAAWLLRARVRAGQGERDGAREDARQALATCGEDDDETRAEAQALLDQLGP